MSILCCICFETFKDLLAIMKNTCTFVQGNCRIVCQSTLIPGTIFCSLPHNGNLLSYSRIQDLPSPDSFFPSCPHSLLLAPIRRVLLLPTSVLQFSIEFENIIALFFPIEKIFFTRLLLPHPFRNRSVDAFAYLLWLTASFIIRT